MTHNAEQKLSGPQENHGYDDQPASECPCCKNWLAEVERLRAELEAK